MLKKTVPKKHMLEKPTFKKLLLVSYLFLSLNFLTPMLTLFYLDRGAGQEHIFLILLTFSMSVFLFEIPTGVFGDKYGLKLSLVLGALCRLIGAVMLFMADSVLVICLSRILDGLGYALFSGALETYCYESLKDTGEEDKLGGFFGKIQSISYLSNIIAYLVGAYIVSDFLSSQFNTLAMLWVIASIIQFLPILLLPKLFERKVEYSDSEKTTSKESHLITAIKNIANSKPLILLFVNYTLIFIPTIIFGKFYQVVLVNLNEPSYMFGVIAIAISLIALGLSYKVDNLVTRFSNLFLFNITGLLVILGFVLVYLFPTKKYLVYLSIFLVCTPLAIRWPVYVQLRNNLIPSNSRTTTISMLSIMDSVFDLLILGMLGLWKSIALENVLLACLVICLVGMMFLLRRETKIAQPI